MHNTLKCEACLSDRMVIGNLIMININYNSSIIKNNIYHNWHCMYLLNIYSAGVKAFLT